MSFVYSVSSLNTNSSSINKKEELSEATKKKLKALNIDISSVTSETENENIEAIFTKIDEKLKALEENNNNSNINVLRSELEILENEFKNMTSGESSILSAMDLLSKSNRAGLGI